MTEHLKHSEQQPRSQELPAQAESKPHHVHTPEKTSVGPEHRLALENIKLKIEEEARPASEVTVEGEGPEKSPFLISKDLKAKALKDLLRQTRRHLHPASRQFSKIIHTSAVEKVSDVAGGTVARPSGLLGAGLFALLGGLGLLFVTNHYGYEYRFSAFLFLLAMGFILGLITELIYRLLWLKK